MNFRDLTKKQIIFLTAFTLLFLIIILIPFVLRSKPQSSTSEPTSVPIFSTPTTDGTSGYAKLKPGRDSLQDVRKIFGTPDSKKTLGNKEYLFYKTSTPDIQNVVMVQNNKLVYATENTIGGKPAETGYYTKTLGTPDITLYDKNDEIVEWRIYSKKGVAVAIAPFENIVVRTTYFEPQQIDVFLKNLMYELGLVKEKAINVEEIATPAP